MTERLYYNDSFLKEFDATVLSCVNESASATDGDRWRVVLDRTAFYPTSGGQPHDTGMLGEARVVEVLDDESRNGAKHDVIHFTDRAIPLGEVHGTIDWRRRFDHIQQHTGQHLLSAAFIKLFNLPTVSFHLGREISTIDVAAPSLDAKQLEAAELRTNEIIFDDRPVNIHYGTAEELAAAGVRKQVDREGVLRAIEIEGFDRQPCGGTHVARTGQIGIILLRRLEKVKQNWRVEFVCGARAARAARSDASSLGEAARLLSCGPGEVPSMVARALEERQEGHRARQRLTAELAEVQALVVLTTARATGKIGDPGVITRVLDESDASYARMLATNVVAQGRVRALIGTRGGHVIFAQSTGLDGDMNALLRECLLAAAGKGGGSKDFAQGSISDTSRVEEILAKAAEKLGVVK
ncbi:MAG TPA: DHHA1 domain-containing protein [Candidatus Acidoferrum sp.]|nr:DHHA1 domain-containing protein [Candidatus Acidoferrum sp.]